MKPVQEIRRALRAIDGAVVDRPDFEWRGRGQSKVLWEPINGGNSRDAAVFTDHETAPPPDEDVSVIVELPAEIDSKLTRPLLGDDDAAKIKASVLVLGVDALAWYIPFHQKSCQWGCYLSVSGIFALADVLLPLLIEPSRRIALGIHALLRHEVTHFAIEYMASQWELSVGAPCYWQARWNLADTNFFG